jgi:GrpB-like predicted nucleotidyltransferase (UPF0157 family)
MSGIPIQLLPHDPAWTTAFEREAAVVKESLGDVVAAIHHIGSTAIPGIFAKPIIDVLVEATRIEEVDARNRAMEAAGYEVMGEYGIPGRRYFRKNHASGTRTHHVHVFAGNDPEIRRHLDFRDLLRAEPGIAAAYSELKLRLAREHAADVGAYLAGKSPFIQRIDAIAARRRAATTTS